MDASDIITVGFLVFLEGLLSFDNAIALAAATHAVPKNLQRKVLTYGMGGAFIFRAISLFFLNLLLKCVWLKVAGGVYLLHMAYKHFFASEASDEMPTIRATKFWLIVFHVELLDLAFSVDSISASAGMSSKYWVILAGGIFGIIMMRFAAYLFIQLLDKYPRLENTAFFLVGIIGGKLCAEATGVRFDAGFPRWALYASMATSLLLGFSRLKESSSEAQAPSV